MRLPRYWRRRRVTLVLIMVLFALLYNFILVSVVRRVQAPELANGPNLRQIPLTSQVEHITSAVTEPATATAASMSQQMKENLEAYGQQVDAFIKRMSWNGSATTSQYVTDESIEKFHGLALDWHDLVPEIESFEELVKSEKEITAALIGLPEQYAWGTQHGPTEDFNERYLECEEHKDDQYRFNKIFTQVNEEFESLVSQKARIVTGGMKKVSDPLKHCQYWARKQPLLLKLTQNQREMHYHFIVEFYSKFILDHQAYDSKDYVIILSEGLEYNFHLLEWVQAAMTESCPIADRAVSTDVCFVVPENQGAFRTRKSLPEVLRHRFGIVSDPRAIQEKQSLTVSIVHRVAKRLLVNAKEIAREIKSRGHRVILLPLELMTPYEQLMAFSLTDVFVGVHGSGLTNAMFLNPGSALVQILPYRLGKREDHFFEPLAKEAKVKYYNLEASREEVFLHKEFLAAKEAATIEDDLARNKIRSWGGSFFFGFLINQDIRLDVHRWNKEFESLVEDLLGH